MENGIGRVTGEKWHSEGDVGLSVLLSIFFKLKISASLPAGLLNMKLVWDGCPADNGTHCRNTAHSSHCSCDWGGWPPSQPEPSCFRLYLLSGGT